MTDKKLLFPIFLAVTLIASFSYAEEKGAEKKTKESVELTEEQAQAIIQKEQDTNTRYLLSKVILKAKALRETYGMFSPFAAGLFPNGKVKFVWLAKPGEVVKDPMQALSVLRSSLRSQALAGRLMSSAVAYDFKTPGSGVTRINVEVEYKTGYARLVSTTYTVDKDKKVVLGKVTEAEYDPFVFSEPTEEEKRVIEQRLKELEEEKSKKDKAN
ncbi:MAG: hypothetical protein CSA52_00390 [Gammaproteobacteria bacterium]|nr:MAG: hypothetical protein CSB48_12405 [Pseudomonadota bacterium]PIE38940.1 MAG: hypothetical protein CSA52_00390 [Gammaproteobacteria bacterium]